jgi:serine O-acetyltransferase
METTNTTPIELPLKRDFEKSEHLNFLQRMSEDVHTALARDPAARNAFEVLTSYAGVHALWGHRVAHWLWQRKLYLPARWLSQITRSLTGVEIHPGAIIGRRFFIDHGMGVVIGETAEIGDDVTFYHGVTLGGVSLAKGKRHPTLESGVVVGAGAKILGAITIGKDSRIGANAVVVKAVPANAVVVGVPGQIIQHSGKRTNGKPDFNHGNMPDAIATALQDLLHRVDELEAQLKMHDHPSSPLQLSEDGTWQAQDADIYFI